MERIWILSRIQIWISTNNYLWIRILEAHCLQMYILWRGLHILYRPLVYRSAEDTASHLRGCYQTGRQPQHLQATQNI
jgi:hypothetical protein